MALGAGLLLGIVSGAPLQLIVAVLALWAPVAYHPGYSLARPGPANVRSLVRAASPPVAVVGLGVAFAGLASAQMTATVGMVAVSSVTALSSRLIRRGLQNPLRVLIVGDRFAIASAATRWAGNPQIRVAGACLVEPDLDAHEAPREILGVPLLFGMRAVQSWSDRCSADLVVAAPGPGLGSNQVRELAWQLEEGSTGLSVLGILDSVATHRISTDSIAGATLMNIRSSKRPTPMRVGKQAFDRVTGLLLLVLFSPVILALMVAVRAESSGPAIFRQTRVGQRGKTFTMYKMRTMFADAEARKAELMEHNESDGILFKMRNDPRITAVGRLLRKTSLDELPQLINVVKGDMSLVGPRPALPEEVAEYDHVTRRRLAVMPGITGLWQVSGRSDLTWDESVRLDIQYADNWRLWDDLVIGLRTVEAVVRSKGAY